MHRASALAAPGHMPAPRPGRPDRSPERSGEPPGLAGANWTLSGPPIRPAPAPLLVVTGRFLARAFPAIDRYLRKELRSARDGAPRSGGAAAPFGFAQGDRRRQIGRASCRERV